MTVNDLALSQGRAKHLSIVVVLAACVASFILAAPTINKNIDDPNMIVYLNADEGYQMDLIWSYYSGQKRDSYQLSLDYGLELVYLSDIAHALRFIKFTPGTFVLILRWLHLLAWMGALGALWFLVGRHFGIGWQQSLAVLILWSRTSFDYFSNNLKPEPLVLLLVIVGLHYALSIVENPSFKNLLISTACASAGFIIKFAGVFLVSAIVAALYFAYTRHERSRGCLPLGRLFVRHSWALPALISAALLASPLIVILFYARKTTGRTYYEELGLLGSIVKLKLVYALWSAAALLAVISITVYMLNKSKDVFISRLMEKVNVISSVAMVVTGLFFAFTAFFGFRWVFVPQQFLETYAQHGMDFSGGYVVRNLATRADLLRAFCASLFHKIAAADIILAALFCAYFVHEVAYFKKNVKEDGARLYKRVSLFVYLIPFFLSMLSIGRFEEVHMLPFIVAFIILDIQTLEMLRTCSGVRTLGLGLITILFIADILVNGSIMVKKRVYNWFQKEDAAFEIGQWFKRTVDPQASIVSDHYILAYVTPGYRNVRFINWNVMDRVKEVRRLVDLHQPRFLYYNESPDRERRMPPIAETLPGKKVRLIKVFDEAGRRYQRYPNSKFFVYEVIK